MAAVRAPRPPAEPRYEPRSPVLLVLPCNPCVRLGNYMQCQSWRVVWAGLWDLISAGLVSLAAVDSCKPGIVPWGEERGLAWCDVRPYADLYYRREPWRLEALSAAVKRDLAQLLQTHDYVVHYLNVKAYKHAMLAAGEALGVDRIVDAGPRMPTVPSYRSRASRQKLRETLEKLLSLRARGATITSLEEH